MMRRIGGAGGYPLWVEEIAKADTRWRDVDEIAALLQARIRGEAGAACLGVFDHYGLNLRVGAALPPAMQDAKAILFCPALPRLDPLRLALCPSVIGVADMGNRFVISFLDSSPAFPMASLASWVANLRGGDGDARL